MTGFSKWLGAGAVALTALTAAAQVQHGLLDVVENDGGNNPTSVTVTPTVGFGSWLSISDDGVDTSNRADYAVDFLTGNDQDNGVLIVGPYEDERSEPSVTADPYYATVSTARSGGSDRFFIPVHNAPGGFEVNYNVALGYFPFADGWIGGGAYNSTNGGIITELTGPLPLYNVFTVPATGDAFVDAADGNFGIRIEGVDMRRDGVLLACGAKNEDNYTAVFINWDGTAVLNNRDNNDNGGGSEQDPTSFVFIPEGTNDVTMGRVTGTANVLFSQGDFTVEMVDQPTTDGTYRLTITGEDPTTGTLLVSPYTEFGDLTVDNPVFVTPEATSWLITTRDIAGMGLQDIDSGDVVFHFAFLPNGVDIQPGTPSQSYVDKLDDIAAARFEVTAFSPDNGNGDMEAVKAMGSDNLGIFASNRGDIGTSWLNARPAAYIDNGQDLTDGVWVGNSTEFVRDNTPVGGVFGWSTVSYDNGMARTHVASETGGEINSNFALAFFPTAAGYQQDADVQVFPPDQSSFVDIGTDDPVADGVLLAINWDNNNRIINATPDVNGYILEPYEASGANIGELSEDWDYGYVYVPIDDPNLTVGHVAGDGTILSGTGFTTSTGTAGPVPYVSISIPGVDAETDGVLVVTGTDGAYAMAWEPDANGDFLVSGLDLTNGTPTAVGFMFAYVPYDVEIGGDDTLPGDMNCDGVVDTFDIDGFIAAQSGQATYEAAFPTCNYFNADINGDTSVDTFDIDAFIALIGG